MKVSKFLFALVFIIGFWVTSQTQWADGGWKANIDFDGKGYYAYLPATFIYQDFTYEFLDSIEPRYSPPTKYYYFKVEVGENKHVNKYYCGVAIAQIPFFLAAIPVSYLTGEQIDGYSKYFQKLLGMGALFYFALGIYFLFKILVQLKFSRTISFVTCLVIAGSTNLYYYAFYEPSMSHIYGFCFSSILIYQLLKWQKDKLNKRIYLSALLYGMLIITRPTNALLILFLPFIFGNIQNLFQFIKELIFQPLRLLTIILIFFAPVSIQLIYYKLQCGDFIVYGYGGEKLLLDHPNFVNFLFSYKKGVFVYAPVLLLSIPGIYILGRKSVFQSIAISAALLLSIYVLSSWWMWWYGGCFGMRAIIEWYPYFAILLAFTFSSLFNIQKIASALAIVLIALCFMTGIQVYQYREGIWHYNDMNKELYWDTFLITSKRYNSTFVTYNAEAIRRIKYNSPTFTYSNSFESPYGLNNLQTLQNTKFHKGNKAIQLNETNYYGPELVFSFQQFNVKNYPYIKGSLYANVSNRDSDIQLVITYTDTLGTAYSWKSFFIANVINDLRKWEKVDFCMDLPKPKSQKDIVKVFFFNTNPYHGFVDDLYFELYDLPE